MKKCDYFACTDYVEETSDGSFSFCCYHLECLQQMIAMDLLEDGVVNSLTYCFTALSSKAYLRNSTIL